MRNPVRSRGFTPYDLYGKFIFLNVLKSLSLSKSLPAWKTHAKIIHNPPDQIGLLTENPCEFELDRFFWLGDLIPYPLN